jgi:hypothetical protein
LGILLVLFVTFAVHVDVIAAQAASEKQRERNPEPFQGSGVPGGLTGHGIHGRLDDGEGRPRAEAELDPPGHQVEMILAAYLSPQRENRDHGDEELGSICQAKCGHE